MSRPQREGLSRARNPRGLFRSRARCPGNRALRSAFFAVLALPRTTRGDGPRERGNRRRQKVRERLELAAHTRVADARSRSICAARPNRRNHAAQTTRDASRKRARHVATGVRAAPSSRNPRARIVRAAQPANPAANSPLRAPKIPRNKTSSRASTREKSSGAKTLQAPTLCSEKITRGHRSHQRLQNAPAAPAAPPAAPSADENAIVLQAPPSTSAETVEVAPRKSASDSTNDDAAGVSHSGSRSQASQRPEIENRGPHSAVGTPATAASGSHAVVGANFRRAQRPRIRRSARTQQMQLASNLSGLTVRTPDSNVFWLVSDGGDVGRSEDGGATWKFKSLALRGLFSPGSAPTAKICWLLAEHGAIFRTTDGKTWTDVPSPAAANDADFQHIEAKDESDRHGNLPRTAENSPPATAARPGRPQNSAPSIAPIFACKKFGRDRSMAEEILIAHNY